MNKIFLLMGTLVGLTAQAQVEDEPRLDSEVHEVVMEAPAVNPSLEISLKAGGHFPQVANALSTSFEGVLKVGYAPFGSRQLQLFADLGYSQPSQEVTDSNPGLVSGEDYSSTLTVQDLATTIGVSWFFAEPRMQLVPYAGAGVRAHFLRSPVTGGNGQEFGENVETETQLGGAVFGGAALRLGPGMVLGELSFSWAPVSQRVTGEANIGALSALVGYGIWL